MIKIITLKLDLFQVVIYNIRDAEMSEWSNEHDWKSCKVKAFAGSNPVLCAIIIKILINF